jgi:hypothetical protein
MSVSWLNPRLTVDDFKSPWSYAIETETATISKKQSQFIIMKHSYTSLETDARGFGIMSNLKLEKKLTREKDVRVDRSPYQNVPFHPYL